MDFWLYPGAYVNVNAPTKVTMTPAAPGEVPPAGVTVIPPQSPLPVHAALARAAEAQAAIVEQGIAANQAIQAASQAAPVDPTPPWEVTFTEKR